MGIFVQTYMKKAVFASCVKVNFVITVSADERYHFGRTVSRGRCRSLFK
jgi:hypothetical protein